jgi:hypothetical protein
MSSRTVIEGNAFYEIDEECLKRKELERENRQKKEKERLSDRRQEKK